MEFKQSLSRRIVIAFVLMTTLVAAAFAIGIYMAVHMLEEKLISGVLSGDLDRLLHMDNMDEWRTRPEPDQLFYFSGGHGDFALPDYLTGMTPGFHEIFREDSSYHAFVRVVAGQEYVLLQDQSEFEERERTLYTTVWIGFVLCVALAVLLGQFLARKVIEPVSRLSRQVRHPDQLLSMAPPLAPNYAADEVGQLAASFDTTLGLLRHALTRERLFTSDVSHELRTPLMVLASSCELLLENPNLDDRARAQVQRIFRACEDMRALVQTFFLLARAQNTDVSQIPTISVESAACELLEQWRKPIEGKGLTLDYRAEQVIPGEFNATHLRTVMSNLLRNALHYTDSGHISLTLVADGFEVEDSGVGIPEEQREAVFQPFVRGDSQRGDGLGLGLSLVQRICASQGWEVSLHPAQPRGCRFKVVLVQPAS